MKVLMIKSIPLAKDTFDAWKGTTHDVKFMKADRPIMDAFRVAHENRYDTIVNLGNTQFTFPTNVRELTYPTNVGGPLYRRVFNIADQIEKFRQPGVLRKSAITNLLPPLPIAGDTHWWEKKTGRGGEGKTLRGDPFVPPQIIWQIPDDTDYQRNVTGTHYRVVTVNDLVVQVSHHNGNRDYQWIGVKAAPQMVKQIAKHAVISLALQNTIVGWDIIANDTTAYILEGNSCPGVNVATAQRILNAVEAAVKDVVVIEEDEDDDMV